MLFHGPAGWGECSLLPGYPCSPHAARRAAAEAACYGFPAPARDAVPVNALVADARFDPNAVDGFTCVKVKVPAVTSLAVDLVARVRDAIGPSVRLRIDANGAWDVPDGIAAIKRLERYDLELVEQPVRALDDMARVRAAVDVPIVADESVRDVESARFARALDAVDAVVLKVQPLGGVRAALRVAEAAGVPGIVTSMHETSVGVAAGLALAAALPELPYACGLATVPLLAGDVVSEPLVPEHGLLRVRTVEPDPDLLARYQG
jgi:O-succinylbenzoate synthase